MAVKRSEAAMLAIRSMSGSFLLTNTVIRGLFPTNAATEMNT